MADKDLRSLTRIERDVANARQLRAATMSALLRNGFASAIGAISRLLATLAIVSPRLP